MVLAALPVTPTALIGREVERRHIEAALDGARRGQSSASVLIGEAGIGKSRLLAHATSKAGGFLVLETRGVQSDFELAYSGLSDLLLPIAAALGRLSDPQAAALRSVFALGPAGHADRFAVAAGCLSLLAAASEDTPLLVLVDDAQWVDGSSAEAITFAGRRLRGERVAIISASRPQGPATSAMADWDVLHLGGLTDSEAGELLAASGHARLGGAATRDLMAHTGGNPLALLELSESVIADTMTGPVPVGPRLERAFGERLTSLPRRTRSALVVLACAGASDHDVIFDALVDHGLAKTDLEAAEDAGLVIVRPGALAFVHPLVRSAAYQMATPAERRSAHEALGTALGGLSDPSGAERRYLHLAAAADGVDESVAEGLVDVGERSAGRGNYAAALQAFEQAAVLSVDLDGRCGRYLRAAELTMPAGRVERATHMLDAAVAGQERSRRRVEVEHLRCRIEMWNGRPVAARDRLLRLASDVEVAEPFLSALMLAHAALTSMQLGQHRLARKASTQAAQLVGNMPEDFAAPVRLVHSAILAIGGDVAEARTLLAESRGCLDSWDPLSTEQLLLVGALAYVSLEATDDARRLFDRAEHEARSANALGLLPFQLSWRSGFEWRCGNWHGAYALAHESVLLARESGWATELPHALCAVALIEAGMGREDDCRRSAALGVELGSAAGATVVTLHAETALALLELGSQPQSAARRLQRVAAFAEDNGLGDPVLLPWAADLIEALVRSGDPSAARGPLERLTAEADRTERPTEVALAHRCAALVGDVDDPDGHLLAALDLHTKANNPFETARTQLALGEHLRRRKHKRAARDHLHEALATFEQLGAAAWVQRARAELAATGESMAPGTAPALDALTAQETQVALGATRGASNAEIAAQLFLSPKTVEYHLSHVYRKLGVRSRAQLSWAMRPAGSD